jgi:hypothetical protein
MSRRIVDAQGGRLTLVETGPHGSMFEILIPRARFPRAIPSPQKLRVVSAAGGGAS